MWKAADEISSAGVAAQLSFLLEAWGATKLNAFLQSTGGILDAIVRETSSSRRQLRKDIGRDNINSDGDVH
jgi:hypothetical protein